MKTISELQQEIRLVRKDLLKMEKCLLEIDAELLSFKDALHDDTNFQHIYNLAEVMPIIQHPVVTMQQKFKSIYFGILLMVATLEDSISDQQLLFLQRIIMSDSNRNRIDYYMGNIGKIQPDNVIFCLDDEVIVTYANQLLLDMFVIAKLGVNCTIQTYGVIADIASFLGKSKEDLKEICTVAVSIITQDCSYLTNNFKIDLHLQKEYGYYLEMLPTWKSRVENAIKLKKMDDDRKVHESKEKRKHFFSSGELSGYGIHLI